MLMQMGGVPGWDDAAHVYKVFLLRTGQSVFWDNYWYGGSYGAITYGVVFYWLAQAVPAKLMAVLAAGALPPLFYVYQRDLWGLDDIWPAWLFAATMAVYLAHGQDPFVLALALTVGGLALLARRHPIWAALPVAVGIFTNPMALVACGVLALADVLSRPAVRRRYAVCLTAVAPALVARLLLGWAFNEPGDYLNETSQLLVYLSFALAGVALAGISAVHPPRPFVILFGTYAALCLTSFVTPGSPLGNNIGRFFMVFGLPLLALLRHSRLRRPFPGADLVLVPIALFAVLQIGTPIAHFLNQAERPQTRPSFFAPALAAAGELRDRDHRLHVVALRRHWEAFYFPEAGFPVTRGWYRQADAIHNSLFYTTYDASAYVPWLRAMGVRYVFLADAALDPWSRREVQILHTSPEFSVERRVAGWTVYELRASAPLAVGTDGGTAHISAWGHRDLSVTVDRPGRYLVKVSWSPYWSLEGGPGRLRRGPGRFTLLEAERAGVYTLRLAVTPGAVIGQVLARAGL
ncbi:MAG: hypothetical protein WC709_01300 [Thermoleophilia bacterium]